MYVAVVGKIQSSKINNAECWLMGPRYSQPWISINSSLIAVTKRLLFEACVESFLKDFHVL